MSSKTIRTGVEGRLPDEIVFVEETTDEPCSVVVGFNSKGDLVIKDLKVYWGPTTDLPHLGTRAEEAIAIAISAARKGATSAAH